MNINMYHGNKMLFHQFVYSLNHIVDRFNAPLFVISEVVENLQFSSITGWVRKFSSVLKQLEKHLLMFIWLRKFLFQIIPLLITCISLLRTLFILQPFPHRGEYFVWSDFLALGIDVYVARSFLKSKESCLVCRLFLSLSNSVCVADNLASMFLVLLIWVINRSSNFFPRRSSSILFALGSSARLCRYDILWQSVKWIKHILSWFACKIIPRTCIFFVTK